MRQTIQILFLVISALSWAQPSGSCITGTTKMSADDIFYGCVESNWVRISEPSFGRQITRYDDTGRSKIHNDNLIVIEQNNRSRETENIGFVPIYIPSSRATHAMHRVIYDNVLNHFYVGVANGKWHRIDNGNLKVYRRTKKKIETSTERRQFKSSSQYSSCSSSIRNLPASYETTDYHLLGTYDALSDAPPAPADVRPRYCHTGYDITGSECGDNDGHGNGCFYEYKLRRLSIYYANTTSTN